MVDRDPRFGNGRDPPGRTVVDATIQAYLDELDRNGQVSPHALQVADARVALGEIQKRALGVLPAVIEDLTLATRPTGGVRIKIVRPQCGEDCFPVILYLHGGCWALGDGETYDRFIRKLANGACAAVVFVEYTLAPEARYPVQIEEAYAVLEHIARDADALRLDTSRIAVAGDCAGGNMAAAITLLAKRRRGPEIAFQLLLYPIIAEPRTTEVGSEAHDAVRWLTHGELRQHIDNGFPQGELRREPTAFPLNASLQQLNDLPEALIIVAEHGITRDDGEEYARRLTDAGVIVTCTRYNGVIHDFMILNALADAAVVRSATAQVIEALHVALHGS